VRDLWPDDWKVGNTTIPLSGHAVGAAALADALPTIRAWDGEGNEVHWLALDQGMDNATRLTA